VVGTGYHDKLSWAACSPPGRIHHGPPNKAPIEAKLAPGGFGASFSPFYQPTKEEILYCVKLSDWWRGVQKEEEKHLVYAGPSVFQRDFAIRRIHRLISEAGPSVPPDGYFDCTVEVSECDCCYILTLACLNRLFEASRPIVVSTGYTSRIILATSRLRLSKVTGVLPHLPIKCCESRCGMLRLKWDLPCNQANFS
jgi:hypothetical protein